MSSDLNDGRSGPPVVELAPHDEKKQREFSNRLLLGAFALVAWVGFYSAGQLVETYNYRKLLAPKMFADLEGANSKPSPGAQVFHSESSFAVLTVHIPVQPPADAKPTPPSFFEK